VTVVTLGATNASGTGLATLTITVAPLGVAPVITSPPTAAGTVGTVFATYTIVATGSPTSYTAVGLPAGLTLNTVTGTINGTPTAAGASVVTLGATNGSGTGNATLNITVAPAGAAPVITSPNTAAGTAGMVFVTYAIVATGSPTSYSAVGLPAGLAVNTATGTINGTPTTAGTSVVTLGATNASGTGNATLTITIAAAGTAPVITSPAVAAGTVGTPIATYQIVATGSPTVYTAVVLPSGLTLNTLTGAINGTPTQVGTTVVTLGATNGFGTGTKNLTITIAAPGVVPVITFPAVTGSSASGQVGTVFETYTIAATGSPSSYSAAGLPPGLSVDTLTGAINGTPTQSGTYPVTISATNSTGTGSATLTISIVPAAFSQIINFSARAFSGVGSDTLIVGFGISGNGMNLLVRGIGPGLQQFGVSNYLPSPILTLYDNNGAVEATDAGWEVNSSGQNDGSLIASTAAEAGAFPLAANSTDSALLVTVPSGVHTTGLLTTNGAEGVGLIEIYDVGGNRFASLTNVSARMEVTPGDGVLIAGLVIVGNAPKTVLIRGIGPTLADFGVTGALADPSIAVFSGATQIASNTGWGTGSNNVSQITSVSAQVGAFALPTGSNDCALLLTLQPGAYTVVVTSVSNATGVALIEVYDTQ
jgi:PKD repeat protein